jgi:hypothetical protein
VSRRYRSRTVGAVLFLAGIVLLSASAFSVLIGVGSVAQLGGSGQVDVPRDGVIVERVRLLQGNRLDRDRYDNIEVRLRTTSSAYDGPYTVCIETNTRGSYCQTATVRTTAATVTFLVTGGTQEPTVSVRVYAAAR